MYTLFPLFVSIVLSSTGFEQTSTSSGVYLYTQHMGISMHVSDIWSLTHYDWNSNLNSFQGLSDQDFICIYCCKSSMFRTHKQCAQ